MLVECGFTRASLPDGSEFTFRPALGRIADLGSPRQIVQLYADLCGGSGAAVGDPSFYRTPDLRDRRAVEAAVHVLATLCDQDDATPAVGWRDAEGWHAGAMSEAEQVLIALHLMQHGVCGKARPGGGGGKYAEAFDVAEHIAAAVAHLGVSHDEAAAMSMTGLQLLYEAKFPEQAAKKRDAISADEYRAFVTEMEERGYV